MLHGSLVVAGLFCSIRVAYLADKTDCDIKNTCCDKDGKTNNLNGIVILERKTSQAGREKISLM